MSPEDKQRLLVKRTAQRDMLLWAASAFLESYLDGSLKAIETARQNLEKAVADVEANL